MSDTVAVANFRTKINADIAAGLLRNAEIPYVIQSQEGMLHGPINPGATILVSKELLDRASKVLGDAGMLEDE